MMPPRASRSAFFHHLLLYPGLHRSGQFLVVSAAQTDTYRQRRERRHGTTSRPGRAKPLQFALQVPPVAYYCLHLADTTRVSVVPQLSSCSWHCSVRQARQRRSRHMHLQRAARSALGSPRVTARATSGISAVTVRGCPSTSTGPRPGRIPTSNIKPRRTYSSRRLRWSIVWMNRKRHHAFRLPHLATRVAPARSSASKACAAWTRVFIRCSSGRN